MAITKKIASYLLLAAAVPSALALPNTMSARDCSCEHNNDAGRWRDSSDPAGRLADLCSNGGGCYQAEAGRMCVSGDLNKCGCAVQAASEWQSWHDDWFLWSAITCGGLTITIT